MSLILHTPHPCSSHPHLLDSVDWDTYEVPSIALQLATPDLIVKPRELHLAFNWGILRSRNFSRFHKLKLPPSGPLGKKKPAMSHTSTMASVRSMTMTLHADVSLLITHPVRCETTYIVWGAIMAIESAATNVPPQNVLFKIAVDEVGGEDLREDARLHENLAERGLTGY